MRPRINGTVLLSVSFAASLFLLAYPLYVIRPFRHQGATELALALQVLRFRPIAMIAAALLAAIAATRYRRAVQVRWRRALAGTAAVLVLGFAALSRTNVYELMFHPVDRPEFVAAAATKLDGNEKVLAITIGEEARAYPIRSISYHHIVNDRLGGVPIAATY
jgi:branched-subunit amino acid transport protein